MIRSYLLRAACVGAVTGIAVIGFQPAAHAVSVTINQSAPGSYYGGLDYVGEFGSPTPEVGAVIGDPTVFGITSATVSSSATL